MLPRTIACEDCGEKAFVRAYGRIEYDWGPACAEDDQVATQPLIKCVRLTIDCPHCGVKTQEFHPLVQEELTR
jgi:DNA-directed RNA polymerase subunit RPC12/RpoP